MSEKIIKNADISDETKKSTDNSAAEETVRLLRAKGMKLATAESCTGGLIAKKITSVAGASECFDCGVVTYSNEMKSKLIGVSEETIRKFGAVSDETALEMCKGVCMLAKSDLGIGVTGIAGPGGGTAEKPVGLVHIGIYAFGKHSSRGYHFEGNREEVRERAAETALKLVIRALNEAENRVGAAEDK